ncbi:MAG: tetratricopeptide repeat protein [Myxococcales bacterium]|nr:tetratricopeptide repeat protein [Myxococcales bacterium]
MTFGSLGCGSDEPADVALAKSVAAALADPSALPTMATETASATTAGLAANAPVAPARAGAAAAPNSDGGAVDAGPADTSSDAGGTSVTDAGTLVADAGSSASEKRAKQPGPTPVAKAVAPTPKVVKNPEFAAKKPATRKPRSRQKPVRKVPRQRRRPRAARVVAPPKTSPASDVPLPPGKDATDLYYDGKRSLQARQYGAAIASLRASQQLRSSARTLTLLGRAYFDANRLKDAERALRKAGSRADALILLATLYQQQGRSARARRTYKALLTHHPNHPRADFARRMLKTL